MHYNPTIYDWIFNRNSLRKEITFKPFLWILFNISIELFQYSDQTQPRTEPTNDTYKVIKVMILEKVFELQKINLKTFVANICIHMYIGVRTMNILACPARPVSAYTQKKKDIENRSTNNIHWER